MLEKAGGQGPVACLAIAWLAGSFALAAGAAAAELPPPLETMVERVACRDDPSQTYALFLPAAYRSEQRWPVLFAFDPMARGRVAVELFQKAAERLGVIVVASNNARNGPLPPVLSAVEAVWHDARARFSIDPDRVYAAGMSGGTLPALILGQARGAGVIACAGPLEAARLPALAARFAWFGVAGDADFNFDATKAVVEALSARGISARFASFDGKHGWPPEALASRALEWLELVAMRNGRRPRDDAFVEAFYQSGIARLRDLVAGGRHDEAADEGAALARELRGLKPGDALDALEAEAGRLRDSPEARKARKIEKARGGRSRNEITRLLALRRRLDRAAGPGGELTAGQGLGDLVGRSEDRLAAGAELESSLGRLARMAGSGDAENRIVARRALDGFAIDTFATGTERRSSGQLETADVFFDFCSKINPQNAAPVYERARTLAARGDIKGALVQLRRAVGLGFADRFRLGQEPEWAKLRDLPDFQAVLAELDARGDRPR